MPKAFDLFAVRTKPRLRELDGRHTVMGIVGDTFGNEFVPIIQRFDRALTVQRVVIGGPRFGIVHAGSLVTSEPDADSIPLRTGRVWTDTALRSDDIWRRLRRRLRASTVFWLSHLPGGNPVDLLGRTITVDGQLEIIAGAHLVEGPTTSLELHVWRDKGDTDPNPGFVTELRPDSNRLTSWRRLASSVDDAGLVRLFVELGARDPTALL
jgi:hypothetical protein